MNAVMVRMCLKNCWAAVPSHEGAGLLCRGGFRRWVRHARLCTSGQRTQAQTGYPASMSTTDRAEFRRLTLQVERDLLAQTHLRTLLIAADTTIADHRQKMRTVKARIKRLERR